MSPPSWCDGSFPAAVGLWWLQPSGTPDELDVGDGTTSPDSEA